MNYRVVLMDGQTFESRGLPRENPYKIQFTTTDGRFMNVPLANVQWWERPDSTSAINGAKERTTEPDEPILEATIPFERGGHTA